MKRMLYPVLALAMAMAGLVSCMVRVSEPPTSEATPELQRELRGSVEMLCAEPRYGASLGRAQARIVSELREAGWEVRLQEFENKQGRFANVIAERGGGAKRAATSSAPIMMPAIAWLMA